jgi:hypothetical protein
MADAALDDLYAADPGDFTALRTKLAAAAKKRGDAAAAKEIGAARKPTTAAWVVNRLAHADDGVKARLANLGERLRAAHAEMDGETIRALSAEQRRLIDDLTNAAFEEASVANPTGALRDDVTGTLQAAVADPDVAARLGRLARAEQWSGFGEFGDTAIVFKPGKPKRKPQPAAAAETPKPEARDDTQAAARREQDRARAAVAAAERAKAEADEALGELQSDLATARLRRDDARRRLSDAERALTAAQDAYDKGKEASREAGAVVKEAKAQVRRRR